MGLEGEEVYTGWAYANGDNFYSESWSIDMPPYDAFVKTSLCDVVGLRNEAAVEIGILNIRYFLPDDSSGRANLDGIDWPNTIKAWSSPKKRPTLFEWIVSKYWSRVLHSAKLQSWWDNKSISR